MRRATTLAVVFVFVVGMALGCGSSNAPPAVGGGGDPGPKPGDPPKSLTKGDVTAAKGGQADLKAKRRPDWIEVEPQGARCVMLFPVDLEETLEKGGTRIGASEGNLHYLFEYSAWPKPISTESLDRMARMSKLLLRGFADMLGGKIVHEKETAKPGKAGWMHQADFTIAPVKLPGLKEGDRMRARAVMTRLGQYTFGVGGPEKEVEGADATKFINSFGLKE